MFQTHGQYHGRFIVLDMALPDHKFSTKRKYNISNDHTSVVTQTIAQCGGKVIRHSFKKYTRQLNEVWENE